MAYRIPPQLAASCRRTADRQMWLDRLPDTLQALTNLWSLTIHTPFEDVSCAWVAPVHLADGTAAVLKLGMPHMEGIQEAEGLRFWDGDPTVRLLRSDEVSGAMLLERCDPGTPLRELPERDQDLVIAALLRRLWRTPSHLSSFRPLSKLMQYWSEETLSDMDRWPDGGLVREGLALFDELPRSAPEQVLLATDLHAGNVLRSNREPWLVIDPKPFIGDPAYDVAQHLFNCEERLRVDPDGTIRRVADLLSLDYRRVRLWTFARAAAEPRDRWPEERFAIAKALRRLV
jgi:streptomycin 6-kinase